MQSRRLSDRAQTWTANWDARLLALGLFLLFALPTAFSWVVTLRQDRALLRTQTEVTSLELAERVSDHLSLRYAMMRSLSHEMSSGEPWDMERFKARVGEIEAEFPGFQAINWVDPEGVIRWVNPESRNAAARGKRLADHPKASYNFSLAKDLWTPQITPPMPLFQGGIGFASYFPVGTKQNSRGFVNAVFRVQPLVTQVLSPRVRQYFRVALVASEGPFFTHGETPERDSPFFVERPLRFEGQEWTLRLAPSKELITLTLGSGRRTLMGLLGVTAALVASILAFRFFREHEARSRLAYLVDASGDLIGLFDAEGRLRYINRSGRVLLGDVEHETFNPEEPNARGSKLLGCNWTELLEHRGRLPTPISTGNQLHPIQLVQGSDWLLRPQNGQRSIEAEVVTFPIRGRRRELFFGVIARDIRERNRLERQLVQSQKMEAVGTLAGGVAHDFNNLLTAIVGNAELAKLDAAAGSELDLSLSNILDASDLAAGLTARLLAFSRRDNPSVEQFGLDDAVQASARLLRRLLREDVALDVVTAAPTATLRGDPAELQQVLMNLVVNARDAIENNGRIQVCTSLDYAGDGSPTALLEVIDNGCGMTPEVLKSVFEPFFTTKPLGKGTGLGLAMVRSAVDRLGGKIAVESRVGDGTRIAISLHAEDKPLSRGARSTQSVVGPHMQRQGRILLAEDSPAIRRVLQTGLSRAGYLVVPKESGFAAMRELEVDQGGFDALLTDVVMPGVDGVTLSRYFRQRYPASAVIFISGYEDEGATLEVVLHGSHLLQKPFRLTEVLEILDANLHMRAHSEHKEMGHQ